MLILFGFFTLFLIACAPYFPTGTSLGVFALTIAVLLVVGWRWAVRLQNQLELAVLSSMEVAAKSGAREAVQEAIRSSTERHPWPVELAEITIPAGGEVVGRTLKQLRLRQETGATVVAVQRSGVTHYDLPPDLPLSPDDHLLLIAEKEQLAAATSLLCRIGEGGSGDAAGLPHRFSRVMVTAASTLCGLTLREAGLRGAYGVSVIGVQRGNERITGPSPEECLRDGDILLVMGSEQGIAGLREVLV